MDEANEARASGSRRSTPRARTNYVTDGPRTALLPGASAPGGRTTAVGMRTVTRTALVTQDSNFFKEAPFSSGGARTFIDISSTEWRPTCAALAISPTRL